MHDSTDRFPDSRGDTAPADPSSLRGRTVLVTGGAGFIGSHLVDRLLEIGASVRVLDDLSTGHRRNLDAATAAATRAPDRLRVHDGSILDAAAVDAAIGDADTIVHLAAMVSVPRSVAEPRMCHAINLEGTGRLLATARERGVRSFVFASSSAVYGSTPSLPSRESDMIDCASPYAASKAAAEAMVTAAGRTTDVNTTSLRFFNVFGPRQDPKSPYAAAIAAFADAIARGRAPRVFGDGRQTRDFVPVFDVVDAIVRAAIRREGEAPGLVCNVGTGRRRTLLDVIDALGRAAGDVSVKPMFEPVRAGDVPHSGAAVHVARDALGFTASTSVDDVFAAVLAEAANT